MLYKDKFPCSPKFCFESANDGTIEWTLKTKPLEAIYWKTYKVKKRDVRITSKVNPEQRKNLPNEIYEDIMLTEHPPIVKQPKVRTL